MKLQRASFEAEITLSARGVKPSFAMPVGSNRGMSWKNVWRGRRGSNPRPLP